MNTEPLKEYLKARDALKEGNKEEALAKLASSLGCKEPTEMMKSSCKELLDLNDVSLTLILDRSKE